MPGLKLRGMKTSDARKRDEARDEARATAVWLQHICPSCGCWSPGAGTSRQPCMICQAQLRDAIYSGPLICATCHGVYWTDQVHRCEAS